jgi:uncharacterized protein (UPF0332 family)
VLRDILRKASEKLLAAELAFDHAFYGEVSSRAYYAVFHAVCAVLAGHGMSFSSHAQVLGAFNREFVKTGLFPSDMGRRLTRMFENRQVADYDWSVSIDKDAALGDLEDARAMLLQCHHYLELRTGLGLALTSEGESPDRPEC